MPHILIELDPAMARALEKVAPARNRQRSRFVRLAIQKALMDAQEAQTAAAYARKPAPASAFDELDLGAWGEWKPGRARRAAGKKKR
jgi:hypothetical protein